MPELRLTIWLGSMDLIYVDMVSAHVVITSGLQALDCGLGPDPEHLAW